MIQIAVCPGKPYDIVSFLEPVVTEVKQMYQRGFVIKKQGVEKFRGRVAILGVTGDIPGISELMVFAGDTSTYGCRVCKTRSYVNLPASSHGRYFPDSGPLRTPDELVHGDPVGVCNRACFRIQH